MIYYFIESVNTLSSTGKSLKGALLQAAVPFFAENFCRSGNLQYLCSTLHFRLERMRVRRHTSAGIFYALLNNIEFRPVWSVNAPTAQVECKVTGSGTLFLLSGRKPTYCQTSF